MVLHPSLRHCSLRLFLLAALVLILLPTAVNATGRGTLQGLSRHLMDTTHYAGWAMDAYPGDSTSFLEGEMRRQMGAGANVVWLGHDNPGEVSVYKVEPALAYAVWAAYRDPLVAHHDEAVAMVQAQQHALDAARTLGVQVVLPVGYQTQMGSAWNLAHPEDARRDASGHAYNGPTPLNIGASFYAPQYRRDIAAYYRWIDTTFVRPYAGTIMMLNLADEPKDGDYSVWADQAFRAAHGFGLHDAGSSIARQQAVGRFESDYVANYAAWSATQWQSIDSAIPVTMSFCGGYGRYMHEGPNIEDLFRLTPANFVVTFDAYPRDGLYNTPLREGDLVALFNLVRTLGYYSSAYNHPLWLWSAANSWGLNEGSNDKGDVADAVANGIYLAELARQTGGDLRGIAVWNYNIKGQGLYNDTHRLAYDPETMFRRVSASFSLLRQLMAAPAGRPDTVILAPNRADLRAAGERLLLRASDQYAWNDLAAPARMDAPSVTLTSLPAGLSVKTVIVLARTAADLSSLDLVGLRRALAEGGTVIASSSVAGRLATARGMVSVAANRTGTVAVWRLHGGRGTLLLVAGSGVDHLFSDKNESWAGPLWTRLLHRSLQRDLYTVSWGGTSLYYTIAHGGAETTILGTSGQSLITYDSSGASSVAHLSSRAPLQLRVARRTYALLVAPTAS